MDSQVPNERPVDRPTVDGGLADAAATDARPAARLAETLGRLPRYLRLTRALLAHPGLGRLRKAGLGAGLAYLASPIDLVPGIVPLLGQLDDLAAMLLALRFALRGLPGPAADALLARNDLSRELLQRDLDNVRVVAGWAIRGTARIAGRVAVASAKAAKGSGRVAARAVGAGGRWLRSRRRAREGA